MLFPRNNPDPPPAGVQGKFPAQSAGCQLPLLLHPAWPAGIQLRFQAGPSMRTCYHYLDGTPALVLSGLTLLVERDSWQQQVMILQPRYPEDRFLWVLPEHLAPMNTRHLNRLPVPQRWIAPAIRAPSGSPLRSTALLRPYAPRPRTRARDPHTT